MDRGSFPCVCSWDKTSSLWHSELCSLTCQLQQNWFSFSLGKCHWCQTPACLWSRPDPDKFKVACRLITNESQQSWQKQKPPFLCVALREPGNMKPKPLVLMVGPVGSHRKTALKDNDAIHQTAAETSCGPYAKWYCCVLKLSKCTCLFPQQQTMASHTQLTALLSQDGNMSEL